MGVGSSQNIVSSYHDFKVYNNNNVIKNGKNIKFIDTNGDIYIGTYKNDRLNGKGTFQLNEGNNGDIKYYAGDWKDGYKHGKGTIEFTEGTTYTGDFNMNEMHGKGKFTYRNGYYFVGDFVGSKQTGKGVLFDQENNKIYEGYWLDDLYHGFGKLYHDNKKLSYEGNFLKGQYNGLGTVFHTNGTKDYQAVFDNGIVKQVVHCAKNSSMMDFTNNSLLENYNYESAGLMSEEQIHFYRDTAFRTPYDITLPINDFTSIIPGVPISDVINKDDSIPPSK